MQVGLWGEDVCYNYSWDTYPESPLPRFKHKSRGKLFKTWANLCNLGSMWTRYRQKHVTARRVLGDADITEQKSPLQIVQSPSGKGLWGPRQTQGWYVGWGIQEVLSRYTRVPEMYAQRAVPHPKTVFQGSWQKFENSTLFFCWQCWFDATLDWHFQNVLWHLATSGVGADLSFYLTWELITVLNLGSYLRPTESEFAF